MTELTQRQKQVLMLIAYGMSDQDIADHLGLSVGTVRRYVGAVRDRLNARNRAHAVMLGVQHKFLVIEDGVWIVV